MLNKMVEENETLNARLNVDLSRLPLCRDSLFTHIQGGNHGLACYKYVVSTMFEGRKPFRDQGWEMLQEGYIEPLWLKGPVLPSTLVDILNCADIDAEVEDIDEMDVNWHDSDDEDDGYG